MSFKYFSGKLKKSANNILRIGENDSNSRKTFDTEVFLVPFINDDKVSKIEGQKDLDKNILRLRAEISKNYFLPKEQTKKESLFVQGYATLNGVVYYVFGQKTFSEAYTLFGVNADDYIISLCITNNNEDNTLLSETQIYEQGEFYDLDCGFGNLKERKIRKFEKYFVDNQQKFNFSVNNEIFGQFKDYFDDQELVDERAENIQISLESGVYYHYEIERKIDPLPYIKEINNNLIKARMKKFGVKNYSDLTSEQMIDFGIEYDDFNVNLMQILVDSEIEKIALNCKMNDDTKVMLGGAFKTILYESYLKGIDIDIAYLQSFYSIEGEYEDVSCKHMGRFVCKKSSRRRFVDALLETLKGNEILAKDIIDLYLDASHINEILLTNMVQSQKDTSFEEIFEKEIVTEAGKAYQDSTNFLVDNLTQMGFSNNEIANLMMIYAVYIQMQDDYMVYDEDEEVSFDENVKRIYKISKRLHSDLIDEFGKRITFLSNEEKKQVLNKNETFLNLKMYYKNGKEKNVGKIKSLPMANKQDILEA